MKQPNKKSTRGSAAASGPIASFKTSLCKAFFERGECAYGARCMFAHGPAELRTKEQNLADGLTTKGTVFAFQRRQSTSVSPNSPVPVAVSECSGKHHPSSPETTTTKVDQNAVGRWDAARRQSVLSDDDQSLMMLQRASVAEGSNGAAVPPTPVFNMSLRSDASRFGLGRGGSFQQARSPLRSGGASPTHAIATGCGAPVPAASAEFLAPELVRTRATGKAESEASDGDRDADLPLAQPPTGDRPKRGSTSPARAATPPPVRRRSLHDGRYQHNPYAARPVARSR